MATYSVAAPLFASHANALVGSTVDTVTFTGGSWKKVEVLIHSATTPVYLTIDNSAPTVAGGATHVLLTGQKATFTTPDRAATIVKLIASATATYSVTAS